MPIDLKGFEQLVLKLQNLAAKSKQEGDPVVAVGFTASYALYVHEDVEMSMRGQFRDPRLRRIQLRSWEGENPQKIKNPRPRKKEPKGRFWDPQGRAQAKFLEGPAREMKEEFGRIVITVLTQGKTLAQGLLAAGLRLQREAQLRVPVDTGNLKASAFTRLEHGTAGSGGETGGEPA